MERVEHVVELNRHDRAGNFQSDKLSLFEPDIADILSEGKGSRGPESSWQSLERNLQDRIGHNREMKANAGTFALLRIGRVHEDFQESE